MRHSKKKLSGFSLRLKAARSEIYTQNELSKKSGVSLRTIQRLENIEKWTVLLQSLPPLPQIY